ncbi:hypothetical protein FKW77_003717 [Venturia effusa]|uniref:NADH:flavin oxidoreductase/NADH oxidase N-terminal domain-containing protein n=1 Tax=Venturia effusa TaxID=50376 RepID=A0A517LIH8_9PEZI|nr:hypothetical protein FKW77_003717 [Venturia effusa]
MRSHTTESIGEMPNARDFGITPTLRSADRQVQEVVQIDIRFLSIPGDVVVDTDSLKEPILQKWREWAAIAQAHGTPCIVQLAHPGRLSPGGAGVRPSDMEPICASAVPVQMGSTWLDKKATVAMLGIPREATHQEIDEVVEAFVVGAKVASKAGFKGVQIHAAHGFLISQFLSPHTNRRTDEYGGSPEGRLKILRRIVQAIRRDCPASFCLSVKLNSSDYMTNGGLDQDEALDHVRWLVTCGMVDMVEISGGSAEQNQKGRLLGSFTERSLAKAPVKKESTRIRESFFTDFAERVQALKSKIPIQVSGGFRLRVGMADAIESGSADLIGLGRAAVLEPDLPTAVLLNEAIEDSEAIAMPHEVKGLWLARVIPAKIVGGGLPVQFFYYNMKRLGQGLASDPDISVPWIAIYGAIGSVRETLWGVWSSVAALVGTSKV